MTITFNSDKLPHHDSKMAFGFVQSRFKPLSISDFEDQIPKCSNCKTKEFPLKAGNFACPICSPESDFIEGSIKILKGNKHKLLYYFAFDTQFPKEKTIILLKQLIDCMNEDDHAIVICISSPITIVSVNNTISFFNVFDSTTTFQADSKFELNKTQISKVVIPQLESLFSLRMKKGSEVKDPIEIIPLIQILSRQSNKRPFASFCFLNSPIAPISAEKAAAASRSIFENKGIIHFGSNEGFKRLSAISRMSMGIVFGINVILPNTIENLIHLSQPNKLKVITPRFMEAIKVTSSEGSMNMSSFVTTMKLTNTRGSSGRYQIDFSRVDENHITSVKFIEIADNPNGRFITLHSFTWSESSEMFDSIALSRPMANKSSEQTSSQSPGTFSPFPPVSPVSMKKEEAKTNFHEPTLNLNKHIYNYDENGELFKPKNSNLIATTHLLLKGSTQDVLRAAWMGQDFSKLVGKLIDDQNIKTFIMSTCLEDSIQRQERGIQKFYYVLYSMLNDLSDRIIKIKQNYIMITHPFVFVYTTDNNPIELVNQYFNTCWPIEVRHFTDFKLFQLAAENNGFKLIDL